jgi:uncharacterized protein
MSSTRRPDPRRLDVAQLAASGAEVAGEWPHDGLARLAAATLPAESDAERVVTFRAAGSRAQLEGAGWQPALQLQAATQVRLECQRCLLPMAVPLRVDRRFFFVPGEDAAAGLDADSDDDVLALTPAFDLRALVEDELLLALPLVPRHETCPVAVPLVFEDDGEATDFPAAHPFAALAALKGGGKAG